MKKFFVIYQKFAVFLSKFRLGKFPLLRRIHKFLKFHLRSKSVKFGGRKFFINRKDFTISSYLLEGREFESPETKIFKQRVKRDDTVLDIGANIGYHTLTFAKLVGSEGRVFAFEPDQDNFALLDKNVKENKFGNVVLVNKAVSDKSGDTKLFLSEDNMGDHRIYDSGQGGKFIVAETVCLDEFLKDHKDKIDFIKMDIQGAEEKALYGMKEILKSNEKLEIVTEFWPIGLEGMGDRFSGKNYLEFLERHNFKFFDIKKGIKNSVDIDYLLKNYNSENKKDTNLLCVKNDDL